MTVVCKSYSACRVMRLARNAMDWFVLMILT